MLDMKIFQNYKGCDNVPKYKFTTGNDCPECGSKNIKFTSGHASGAFDPNKKLPSGVKHVYECENGHRFYKGEASKN